MDAMSYTAGPAGVGQRNLPSLWAQRCLMFDSHLDKIGLVCGFGDSSLPWIFLDFLASSSGLVLDGVQPTMRDFMAILTCGCTYVRFMDD